MVDPNTRQGKRTPVTLKIKFKSETLEQFIERYAVDVSQGGIFIRTKEPLAVGTQMRFEFQLRDASPLIAGEGTVVWTRENDPSRPAIAPGMGVRFDRLAEGSQQVLERILAEKQKQAPARPPTETTKPPMFTDTPTRVAPMPVQEALLGTENAARPSGRKRDDSFGGEQGTPLPRPMPFHSDAEDFDEQAFEEATKVRALDELIAQTADASPDAADDLALRRPARADSTLADPPRADSSSETNARPVVVDRDSAPGLPSPPEPSRPQPRLLDTTPSPRAESAAPVPTPAAAPAVTSPAPSYMAGEAAKTRLGVEPAARAARPSTPPVAKDAVTKPTGMRAAAAAQDASSMKLPAAKSSSSAPLIILLLLLVAAGGAAVWFFVLREKVEESVATGSSGSGQVAINNTNTGSGSAEQVGVGSGSAEQVGVGSGSAEQVGSGSAGSATAMTGSNTGNGSATVAPAELVDTVIAASADKASIEILGTDHRGPAPLKAKLEKGKAYKARVIAPGFAMTELDLKGGDSKTTAKLVAKPRVISVTSEPPGATILVDSTGTGKTTPFTIELTKSQAAKRSVRIGLRKNGYKYVERMIDGAKFTEDAAQMIAKVDESLVVQVQINNNTGGGNNTVRPPAGSNAGSGSAGVTTGSAGVNAGSGSATAPVGTGTGSGSAVKPVGTGTGTGSGSATTPTPTPTPGAGSGSAVKPTPTPTPTPGAGSGSATIPAPSLKDGPKPSAGSGSTQPSTPTLKDGPKEPEPDFMKKNP